MFITPFGDRFGNIRKNITHKIVVMNYVEPLDWHLKLNMIMLRTLKKSIRRPPPCRHRAQQTDVMTEYVSRPVNVCSNDKHFSDQPRHRIQISKLKKGI